MLLASTRIVLLALGLAALALVVPPAANAPGDYHQGATLICSDCHVMHGQQSHGYNPDGSGFWTPIGAGGPFTYLLRDEINDLCLSCHNNNSFAPDVLDVNTGKVYGNNIRLAGFLNREGGPGLAPTGHTLDTVDPAPGSSPAWNNPDGLNCVDCHHQHGRTGSGGVSLYRNLVADSGNSASWGDTVVDYAIGTNDLTKDVYETAPRNYSWEFVQYNEPDNVQSAYATWCSGCHTNFHGDLGGPEVGGVLVGTHWEEFVRHPQAGVNIGGIGGGHSNLGVYTGKTNRVKVMSESGVWDPPAADVTPSCMSCHKSHGNANPFGLLYMSGTGTLTENGDSNGTQPKDLCKQCHVQG